MKQPIRYFSVGLITAGLILLIFSYVTDDATNEEQPISLEEMIATVKDEGYHVLSASEYINLVTIKEASQDNGDTSTTPDEPEDNETNHKDENEAENADEDNAEEELPDNEPLEEEITDEELPTASYTLNVKPGMSSRDISNLLAEHQIVADAEAFNRYLEVEGYAPYVQLGKFTLTSNLTQYQIAEKIANKQ